MMKSPRSLLLIARCTLALMLLCASSNAHAQISVDNVLLHFSAKKRPVHNVVVSNASDGPGYVTVEVEELMDPANGTGASSTGDLLASPKAFSVEPHGQRTVRLLLKSPPGDKERVFRVSFVPHDKGFGEEIVREAEGRKAVIRVLTGMGILVFADPKNPHSEVAWRRAGDKIVFTNIGTINMYLGDGKSCTPNAGCEKLPSKRLYPGNTLEVSAPAQNAVTYLTSECGTEEYQKISIPVGDGEGGLKGPSSREG